MILRPTLEWPPNIKRNVGRRDGQFKADRKRITVVGALGRLEEELGRHGARDIEISAQFGRTRGGNVAQQWAGGDPGCCIRYDVSKIAYTLPCDTYTDLAQNIAAIAAHLDAARAMERYGVATTAQTMGAFAALPPSRAVPIAIIPQENWWDVLSVAKEAPTEVVRASYRALALKAHPDSGGSHEAMSRLQVAYQDFEKERDL